MKPGPEHWPEVPKYYNFVFMIQSQNCEALFFIGSDRDPSKFQCPVNQSESYQVQPWSILDHLDDYL